MSSSSSAASSDASVSVKPVILCGPSGVGKSTLIARLRAEFPSDYGFSVSHTTRAPRAGEEDGVHYNFVVDRAAMEAEIAAGEFLESANVHGQLYGTSRAAVAAVTARNLVCILDIDVQGVASCRRLGMAVDKYIFIAPPNTAELERRLRARGTETEERIAVRLGAASKEMAAAAGLEWDAYIVNDDLDAAYATLRDLLAEGRAAGARARAAAAATAQ